LLTTFARVERQYQFLPSSNPCAALRPYKKEPSQQFDPYVSFQKITNIGS